MPPLESEIQRSILDWLTLKRIFHFRCNNQGRWLASANRWIPTAGIKGVADILGFYKGKFFALEVKRPGGKVTPEQTAFLEVVKSHGHIGEVVYSLQDVIRIFS